MKKNLFVGFIAMTALTVTSCTNDEVVEAIPQKQAIEFGTYLGRDAQSRGLALDEVEGLSFDEFGVLAYYTGQDPWLGVNEVTNNSDLPNFMYNQSVSKSDGATTWTYTPKKYWPTTQGDMITFFAYAPMATGTNGINISGKTIAGTPTVTYTIDPAKLENMADFVADALIDQTRKNSKVTLDDNNELLTFGLNHELTRVNIQAKLSAEAFSTTDAAKKTKVNITDIKFIGAGFATTGTYTFANVNDVATDNIKRGTWSYTSDAKTAVSIFDTNNGGNNKFVNKAPAKDLGTYTIVGVSVPTTEPVDLFIDHQYLFLIPANGEEGIVEGKNVSMYVSYDIVTADANLSPNYSKTSAVKEIALPVGLLKQGKAYNIILTFGMNEITLGASVDEWGTYDTVSDNANVDYPKTDK